MASLKRLLCSRLPQAGQPIELPAQEGRHAVQVLRLRNGQEVEIMDGRGGAMTAVLRIRGEQVFVEHPGSEVPHPMRSAAQGEVLPLTLELSVLKGDAMEWSVEKAVELGVARLVPVLTAHTVVQIKNKGPEAFQARWQKIADQSLKQCGRLERMQVDAPASLDLLLAGAHSSPEHPRLWFDESTRGQTPMLAEWLSKSPVPSAARLLIGPEGGWSEMEIELLERSCYRLSLGPLVLRAETAAICAMAVVGAHFRKG